MYFIYSLGIYPWESATNVLQPPEFPILLKVSYWRGQFVDDRRDHEGGGSGDILADGRRRYGQETIKYK